MDPIQAVTFILDEETYGVPITQVREIVAWAAPIRVPDAPPWIEGLIDLRGQLVPVIDLRRRFRLPPTPPLPTRCVIVVTIGSDVLGLQVDAVKEVAFMQTVDQLPTAAASVRSHFITGVARIREGSPLVLLLDMDRLLTADEIELLPTSLPLPQNAPAPEAAIEPASDVPGTPETAFEPAPESLCEPTPEGLDMPEAEAPPEPEVALEGDAGFEEPDFELMQLLGQLHGQLEAHVPEDAGEPESPPRPEPA